MKNKPKPKKPRFDQALTQMVTAVREFNEKNHGYMRFRLEFSPLPFAPEPEGQGK